jgi:hypothetical protein
MADARGLYLASENVRKADVGAGVEVGRLVPMVSAVGGDPEAGNESGQGKQRER